MVPVYICARLCLHANTDNEIVSSASCSLASQTKLD